MDVNSPEFADFLDQMIERKAEKIIQKKLQQHGNVRGWDAIVDSVNGDGTINVKLPGETNIIPNLKNKTGKTLVANDEVFLFSISSLSNAFVLVAKNK